MDRENTVKEPTLYNLVKYLAIYDERWRQSGFKESPEYLDVVRTLLDALKRMPDCMYRFKGSYALCSYQKQESDLFYIFDMGMLKALLSVKRYAAFTHEVYDFLNFKIMRDDADSGPAYLPKNIKDALILVMESEEVDAL